MTDHVDHDGHVDHDESTVIGSRRQRSAAAASLPTRPADTVHGPHAAAEPTGTDRDEIIDDTVLSSRPRSGGVSSQLPDTSPHDDTVLSSRPRSGAVSGEDPVLAPDASPHDDTVLSSRPRSRAVSGEDSALVPDTSPNDDTVLSSRPRPGAVAGEDSVLAPDTSPHDDTVLSSRPRPGGAPSATPDAAASDDTIVVPRRRSTVRDHDESGSDEDAVLRWSPTPRSDAGPTNAPLRTPRESVIDDQVRRRVASSPEPAILREPYRPRPIETTPVNRLQPTQHEVREPVDTVAAEARRRGDSRRTLVAVLAVGAVIVLAGVAGIVALLTGLV